MRISQVVDTIFHGDHSAGNPEGRIAWIDAARALCMIMVVAGHAIDGFRSAGLLPENGIASGIWYLVYTIHMPGFFFLSGLLAKPHVKNNERKFLNHAFIRIAYPYFLWSFIQMAVVGFLGDAVNYPRPFDLTHVLGILTGHIAQFWFLKTLFFLHIAYFAFNKFSNDKLFLLAMVILRGCGELYHLPEILNHLSDFGLFYALGTFFSDDCMNWPSRCRFPFLWSALFGVTWFVFALAAWRNNVPVLVGEQLHYSLLAVSITGVLFVMTFSGTEYVKRIRPLLYVGQRTLPIFLLHLFFVAGVRILFAKSLGPSNAVLMLSTAILAGFLGPLAVFEIARKFRVHHALGLG